MTFVPNQPVTTSEPQVVVDAGLPPGQHRFQLVVINQRRQSSAPAEIVVTVVRSPIDPVPIPVPRPVPIPTPVPGPVRPEPNPNRPIL